MLSKTLLAMLALAPGVALAQSDKTQNQTQRPQDNREGGLQSRGMDDKGSLSMDKSMDKQGTPALCKSSKAIGADVMGSTGEKIGSVNDLLIDSESGKISFVVIDRGGVLGMGTDHYVVPTRQLDMGAKGAAYGDRGDREGSLGERDSGRMGNDGQAQGQAGRADGADRGDEAPRITLRMTAAELEQSPRLKTAGSEQLDQAWVTKTRQQFGVTDRGELIRASTLKKHAVVGTNDERLGEVDEIIVDHGNGQVAYCVIGVGGFAGLGERKIAVPWDTLTFQREAGESDQDWKIRAPLTEERVSQAPQYDTRDWQRMANPVYLREVYVFYDARPYWSGNVREAGFDRDNTGSTGKGSSGQQKMDDQKHHKDGRNDG